MNILYINFFFLKNRKKGIYLILCNLQPTSIDPLNRVGFLTNIDDEDDSYFKYFNNYDSAIEWCENMVNLISFIIYNILLFLLFKFIHLPLFINHVIYIYIILFLKISYF